MDERVSAIRAKAIAIALAVGFLYQLAVAIWKVVHYRVVEAATSEIVFIVLVCTVFVIMAREDERLLLPRIGSDDPEELLAPAARRSRMVGYLKQSLALAIAFTAISAFAYFGLGLDDGQFGWVGAVAPWVAVGFVLAGFLIEWLIFFAIGSFWGEREVRRFVRSLKELGEE